MRNKQIDIINNWIPIKSIENQYISLNNGERVQVIKVEPINFKLKTKIEQKIIIDNYRKLLKAINADIQIAVLSKKSEIKKHINDVLENVDTHLKEIARDYINLMKEITAVRGSVSRSFYIVIKYKEDFDEEMQKLREGLNSCGNEVILCNKKESKEILKVYLSKRLVNLGG
jgi:spore germination protein YaaH